MAYVYGRPGTVGGKAVAYVHVRHAYAYVYGWHICVWMAGHRGWKGGGSAQHLPRRRRGLAPDVHMHM